MTSGTSEPAPKSKDASQLGALTRTLQSMSRRFPSTYLQVTPGVFGVHFRDGTSLSIVCNGHLTDADIRDWLVLFARWLVTDPDGLKNERVSLGGASSRVRKQ